MLSAKRDSASKTKWNRKSRWRWFRLVVSNYISLTLTRCLHPVCWLPSWSIHAIHARCMGPIVQTSHQTGSSIIIEFCSLIQIVSRILICSWLLSSGNYWCFLVQMRAYHGWRVPHLHPCAGILLPRIHLIIKISTPFFVFKICTRHLLLLLDVVEVTCWKLLMHPWSVWSPHCSIIHHVLRW